jgi:hypothetical protein
MMDKIAQMESALVIVSKKVDRLEEEKKNDEENIQLLQTKLDNVHSSEPDVSDVDLGVSEESEIDDIMNLQTDS